jgi:ketosteroid isomerase-like protein
MIRRRLAWLCLFLLPTILWAGQKQKKNKQPPAASAELFPLTPARQINRDISEMLAAWQLGDVGRLRRYYADDVTVVSGLDQPPIQGWNRYLVAYQQQHRRIRSGQIIRRNTFVQVHGDVAWASYQWEFGGLVDGQPADFHGHTTLIFEHRGQAWLIVLNHTSLDAPAGNAAPRRTATGGSGGPVQPNR